MSHLARRLLGLQALAAQQWRRAAGCSSAGPNPVSCLPSHTRASKHDLLLPQARQTCDCPQRALSRLLLLALLGAALLLRRARVHVSQAAQVGRAVDGHSLLQRRAALPPDGNAATQRACARRRLRSSCISSPSALGAPSAWLRNTSSGARMVASLTNCVCRGRDEKKPGQLRQPAAGRGAAASSAACARRHPAPSRPPHTHRPHTLTAPPTHLRRRLLHQDGGHVHLDCHLLYRGLWPARRRRARASRRVAGAATTQVGVKCSSLSSCPLHAAAALLRPRGTCSPCATARPAWRRARQRGRAPPDAPARPAGRRACGEVGGQPCRPRSGTAAAAQRAQRTLSSATPPTALR